MKKVGYMVLLLSLIVGAVGIANATPGYLSNFSSAYPGASSSLNTCGLCHASSGPPALNPYGQAFSGSGHNFQAVESQDSDGDGFSNIDEINAGTFPGDPASVPAPQPPPPTSAMELPTGQMHVGYQAVSSPVLGSDPMLAKPIGIGAVASGGDTLTVGVNFTEFSGGADIYLAYAISTDPSNVYILGPDLSRQKISIQEVILALEAGVPPAGIEPWKSNTTGPVSEVVLNNVLTDNIAIGTYSLFAVVTPSGTFQNYYLWRTGFIVDPLDGAELYAQNCASCHGSIKRTTKAQASESDIQSAINNNVGGMGYLRSLSPERVRAIAHELVRQELPPPPPAPSTTDGATLYSNSCSSCHGALASSTKTGRTATQIQNAIDGNTGGMGILSNLTSEQVQAIADVLAQQTPPPPPPPPTTTDGATLYADNCSLCHGTLANSAKMGRTATQIQNAINNNTGGMGSINLTSAQIQAIADVLAQQTTPPPPPPPTTTDGATLYADNCALCHGTLANSAKMGRTATQIQNAINNNTGGMGSINLTSAQIQAIADVLATQTPIPPATNHPANWYKDHRSYVKNNGTLECTSCHGADLTGGTGPSCYSCHGKKW